MGVVGMCSIDTCPSESVGRVPCWEDRGDVVSGKALQAKCWWIFLEWLKTISLLTL